MKIVQANAVYDQALRDAHALLAQYHTLTEWSAAMTAAGAEVIVVQRFHTAGRVEQDGVRYEFVKDSQVPWLSTGAAPPEFVQAIAAHGADVIHVNGLIFPQLIAEIRKAAGMQAAIVAQHHGGDFPIRGGGIVGLWQRRRWRVGLAAADAVSFTAKEQVEPWRAAGVVADQRIVEVVESGTTLRHVERVRAETAIGVSGNPLILWVGRLTTNKDPLTVLEGLERALAPHHAEKRVAGTPPTPLPDARVVMVFGDDTLIDAVDARVRASQVLSARVTLAGRVPREELPNYYSAADIFVSGSHSEGSGYALIEAMAAGVVPVVTDIPPFRVIAGPCGARWTPGDADAFAGALIRVCSGDRTRHRALVSEHYHAVLRWEAIAERTLREYRALVDARRGAPA